MAKKQRWLLRLGVGIDGGLTTANVAHAELDKIVKALEDAGYLVLDTKGFCAPMIDYVVEKAGVPRG